MLKCSECVVSMNCDICEKYICHKINGGCLYSNHYVFNVFREGKKHTIIYCEECARDLSLHKRK